MLRAKSRKFRNALLIVLTTLVVLMSRWSGYAMDVQGCSADSSGRRVVDAHGAIIRGDLSVKALTLVFTGDEFADGGEHIRQTLKRNKINGAFFLTGNFYANAAFKHLVESLRDDGHYLGAHSDRHLLYADWNKRDSLLVTQQEFKDDLLRNYQRMKAYGIQFSDAPFFLPPYEWYNKQIAEWTHGLQLQLVNFSPGTRSAADYTFPEMGERYVSSDEIYKSIMMCEDTDPHGLNGFMLLVHIGTDPRRTDKFYHHLDKLIGDLRSRGYRFVSIGELLRSQDKTGGN